MKRNESDHASTLYLPNIFLGKVVKTQEYFLGHWSIEKQAKLDEDAKLVQESGATPPTTKVEGMALPYVELVMDEGNI